MNKSRRRRIGKIQHKLLCLASELREIRDEENADYETMKTNTAKQSSRYCAGVLYTARCQISRVIMELDNAIIAATE